LGSEIVTIAEPSESLLTGAIPDIETDSALISVEGKRMNIHTQCGDVFCLKLASKMTFHERGLANTAISDENEFVCIHLFV
jgi:hypothetical protein